MQLSSLEDLFIDELKDLYNAKNPTHEGAAKNGESRHLEGPESRI
jgi:hypothetical protein